MCTLSDETTRLSSRTPCYLRSHRYSHPLPFRESVSLLGNGIKLLDPGLNESVISTAGLRGSLEHRWGKFTNSWKRTDGMAAFSGTEKLSESQEKHFLGEMSFARGDRLSSSAPSEMSPPPRMKLASFPTWERSRRQSLRLSFSEPHLSVRDAGEEAATTSTRIRTD